MSNEFKFGSENRYRSHMANVEVRRHLQSLPVFDVVQDTSAFHHLLAKLSIAEAKDPKER